jgi:GT2 family glycosyltransferase
MTARPALDIIIVSHNTRHDLAACLASIETAPPASLGTVFVVDNASVDGSPDVVRERWPGVELVQLDRNVGFGAANNVALARATSPLVVFLNSDTVVGEGAFDRLVDRLIAAGAVAAGPRLVDAHGRPELSFGAMLTPLAELAQSLRGRVGAGTGAIGRRYLQRRTSRERRVDWVSGACLLVRRDAVMAAGGFDERYFMYEEDVDLCAALRARGGQILFTPAATITHLRGRSIQASGGTRRTPRHYDLSHLAFYEKHAPRWAPWLRRWLRVRRRLS